CLFFRPDGAEERVILHPYAMLLYKDAIFVVAKRLETGKVEALPLERLRDSECLVDERFALPRGFDGRAFAQGQFGLWRAGSTWRSPSSLGRGARIRRSASKSSTAAGCA